MTFWLWQTGVRGSPSISSVGNRWMSQVHILKCPRGPSDGTWGQTKTRKKKPPTLANVQFRRACNYSVLLLKYGALKRFNPPPSLHGTEKRAFRRLNIGSPHYHAVEQQGDSGTLSSRCIYLFISCCGNRKRALRGLPKSSRHIALRTLN